MIIQEPVQAAIWHCLNHYAYTDAVFLSERLYAEVKNDDSLFLLATSYFRSGYFEYAYDVLKDGNGLSQQCKYLFACCAYELKKYAEAETLLVGRENILNQNLENIISEYGDQAPFVLSLLAKLFANTERKAKAAEAFKKALKINPFLWSCFVELCNKGEKPNPNSIFQINDMDNFSMCQGSNLSNVEGVFVAPTTVALYSNFQEQNNIYSTSTPGQIVNSLSVSNHNMKQQLFNTCITPEEAEIVGNSMPLSGIGFLQTNRVKRSGFQILTRSVSPSFGVFPLESFTPDSLLSTPRFTSPTTLTETNDQKSFTKRVRGHIGQLISRKETPLQNSKPVFSQSSNVPIMTPSTPAPISTLQPSQNVRRSSRLFSNSYSVKENNKSPNRNKFVTPKSPSRKIKPRISKTNTNKNSYSELNARNKSEKEKSETITSSTNEITKVNNHGNSAISNNVNNLSSQQNFSQNALSIQKQSAEGLMSLLRDLGTAYCYLSQFKCKDCINVLKSLPPQHYNTPWVQSMMGLAHFEMAEYNQCVEYFALVHEKAPYRLQHMETYSTALWHLQKEVELSALAQELIQVNKNSPVTWCVAGNCFSLHKEHDIAIKFFHRAVQVDPTFPYAYTLLGHEYIMTEELDKAMTCFRNAIRLDSRHYKAWFGLGTIYSKQERFHLAEINYSRALEINAYSSVLMCHIAVVQHALKKTEKALNTLNMAISNDPKNPLCKFHRGSIYFAVGRHAEALKELEELKEIVPKESLVYYLIGKVHKKLGNTELALMHFSWATDLDPKGASSQIKEAFDPVIGRSHTDADSPDSPHTPSGGDFPSESNSVPQIDAMAFHSLPEDSDDSL